MQYAFVTICCAAMAGAWMGDACAQEQLASPVARVAISAGRMVGDPGQEQLRDARAELARRAGGTALVDAVDYLDGRAATVSDALSYAPGVLAQTRHGQETRLSIRGSGIQRGFLMRGIGLYQDGIPLNHADGTGDFQAIDPVATHHIEVSRGANALEYGANGLGGALNFISPTGITAPGARLRLQAGTFGQRQAHAMLAGRSGPLDAFASVSRAQQGGWREQSAYASKRFSGNAGLRLTDTLELRSFLSYVDADLEVPGSLTGAAMRADPRRAAPQYGQQDARNDVRQQRVALRLAWTPRAGVRWTGAAFASARDRFHAMTLGILRQDMDDTGIDSRLAFEFGSPVLTRRLVAGMSLAHLNGEEFRFANVAGRPSASTGRNLLDACQGTLYAEYTHGLGARWNVQAGWQGMRARRALDNLSSSAASYQTRFTGSAPRLGILFAATPTSQWFANLSGSVEAPPFAELVYSPARALAAAQGASTVEVGWRGQGKGWRWDAVAYRANVRRELLSLADARGVALGTINADRTVHQGGEVSASGSLTASWQMRMQYLYNDFRFDDDAVYGSRRLAGIPPHLMRVELRWQRDRRFRIASSLDWQPSGIWIDHANTVAAGGFALLNLTLDGDLDGGWRWFIEARNLSNRRYVATTAVQANAQGRDGAFYFPGDRRAVYVGVNWQLR